MILNYVFGGIWVESKTETTHASLGTLENAAHDLPKGSHRFGQQRIFQP